MMVTNNTIETGDETRAFPLRVVLTVTTGRLLTADKGPKDNGISDLYEILGYMTGEPPYTHTLGRFASECKPALLAQYPVLADVDLDELDRRVKHSGGGAVESWLVEFAAANGLVEDLLVRKASLHRRRDPLEELAEMRGSSDGIIVVEA